MDVSLSLERQYERVPIDDDAMSRPVEPNLIEINQILHELEREADLPPGFCTQLLLENDDWSFVVKLHALCETAITQTVLKTLERPEIDDTVARLFMKTKIVLAVDLKILSKDSANFLGALGFLRNRLAHDVRQVGRFSLAAYEVAPPTNAKVSHLFGPHLASFKGHPYFAQTAHRVALLVRTLLTWHEMGVLRLSKTLGAADTEQAAFLRAMTATDERVSSSDAER